MKRLLAGAVMALVLSSCGHSSSAPQPSEAAAIGDSREAIAESSATASTAFPPEKLPASAPPPPITGSCSTKLCASSQVTFVNHDWPMAWSGDYDAQRNVAFCRATGCLGAVQVNQVEACSWRALILAAKADKADDTDTANLNVDCGKLDNVGALTAKAKVQSMSHRIYGN